MQAIVLAAGEGRRLRPLTESYAKPVLPIDGRPVVVTLLREMAAAGIERVTMVTGHLADQVERLVGDGSELGLSIEFVRQPRPNGSADAAGRALTAGAATPALISAADTVFVDGDIGRFVRAFAESAAAGAIAWRSDPPAGPGRPPLRIVDGLVQRVLDDDPENPRGAAPLFGFGPELAPFLEDLAGPPYELADVYQRAIESGLAVAAVEIGKTRDLTDPLDLVRENFPYLRSI
jgi:dTDP-glucose pyrophosphorylase